LENSPVRGPSATPRCASDRNYAILTFTLDCRKEKRAPSETNLEPPVLGADRLLVEKPEKPKRDGFSKMHF
jgi:hypothetical protein